MAATCVRCFTVLHRSVDPPADLGVAIDEADHGNAVGLETSRETVAEMADYLYGVMRVDYGSR